MIVLPHFVWLGVAATKAKLRQRGTLTNLTTLGGWLQSPSNIFKLKSQLLFLHIFLLFTPLRVGWPPTPQVYFGP